jgi:hypothetical protein
MPPITKSKYIIIIEFKASLHCQIFAGYENYIKNHQNGTRP